MPTLSSSPSSLHSHVATPPLLLGLPAALLATFLVSGALVSCSRGEDQGGAEAETDPKASSPPPASGATTPGVASGPGATGSAGRYGSFQTVITEVARKTVPSVVSITSERAVTGQGEIFGGDPFEFFFGDPRGPQPRRESGLGSGVVVDRDGTILTNNHVIEGAQKLNVQLADEREFEAEVVGADKPTDLAVIRLKDAPKDLAPLELGDSDPLLIGEWVMAVGAPFGLYETVTVGIISAKGRQNTGITTYGNFLQTDAAINPGNSGGPLVNLDGKVIGINTAIYSQSGGYQGIGFAIPINLARHVMAGLLKEGKVVRGWLGVSIQPLTLEMAEAMGLKGRKGALIAEVIEGGPAEKAGLKSGDVVTALEGRAIVDANDLMNQVAQVKPGTTVELTLWRDGKQTRAKAKVAEREEERLAALGRGEEGGTSLATLGIEAGDVDDTTRRRYRLGREARRGAVVLSVDPAGPAAGAGVREGDVILEADRKPVRSAADLGGAVSGSSGRRLLLLVHRRGTSFYLLLMPR
ncbi:MAG TPA: DegQ family serine endoprotease [Fibrobacteria bacterium]|nr:DegQ family serine endoprotease [Fibrobacteria bacterium]